MPPLSFEFNTNVQTLTKRAACDRCHGQKMRCVAVKGSGKCNRCRTANAACNYSAPQKPGRPTAKVRGNGTLASIPNVRSRSSENSMGQPPASVDGATVVEWDEPSHQEVLESQCQRRPIFDNFDCHETSTSFAPRSIPGTGVVSTPTSDANCSASSNTTSTAFPPWALHPIYAANTETEPSSLEECVRSWDEIIPVTEMEPYCQSTSQQCLNEQLERNASSSRHDRFEYYQTMCTPPSTETAESEIPTAESAVAVSHVSENYVQQLSELSGIFSMHHGSQASSCESLQSRGVESTFHELEQRAGNVLERSIMFLNILLSMLQSKIPTQSSEGELPGESITKTRQCLQRSNSLAHLHDSHPLPLQTSPPSLSPTRPLVTDVATTLQLLVCYIRLVDLHHNLYINVQRSLPYLQETRSQLTTSSNITRSPSRNNSHQTLFPFSIASRTLSLHPRFHLQLLVQVCTHYLGEIESALGLPNAFRVGVPREALDCDTNVESHINNHEAGDSVSGLLDRSENTLLLVQTVMMEAEQQRLTRARKDLEELRNEFRKYGYP